METPIQVARRANVDAQTIRNYSKQYGEFLSPSGRGENGPRLYSDEDVEVLCTIAALRKSGMPPREVAEHIRNQETPSVIDVTPQVASIEPQEDSRADTKGEIELYSGVKMVLLSHQNQIDELRREIRSHREDRATWLIIGFALCLVVVAVALWLR